MDKIIISYIVNNRNISIEHALVNHEFFPFDLFLLYDISKVLSYKFGRARWDEIYLVSKYWTK